MTASGKPPSRTLEGLDAETAQALLRALFAESEDAVGVSSEGVIRMVNPALVALFGYDDERQVIGASVLDLIAPDARPAIAEFVRRRSMGEEVPPVYVTRGLRRDGTEFAMQVRSTTYVLRGETQSLTILRDVSREEAAERAVRQGEAFYRALFEVNTAVKLLIDPESGRIVDANRPATELYGWSLDELRRMRITDINMLTDEEVRAEMGRARTGKRRYFRFRHRTASGQIRHVEVHSGPVEIDGRPLLLSIIHDVTERDALAEQLRRAQRMEAIGQLAGGIAHDFNNLLGVMLACADVVRRELPEDSPARPSVDDLMHAGQRATEMTKDLLAFSRGQRMSPTRLDLGALAERMVGMLERTLGGGVLLRASIERPLPHVHADPALLEQVVVNLVLNARDAMSEHGTITIRTATEDVAGDDPIAVPEGSWVILSVADEGEGMDEETRLRVFEPFFTTKGSGRGTGLGLSTVYSIVRQSGGHITVSSVPGKGSRFTVYLPPTSEDDDG